MIDDQNELVEDEVADATASSPEEAQEEVESQTEDEGQQPSEESEEEQMDDEVIITIGDEKPPEREDGTPLVRKLRNLHREAQKENRELKAKLREIAEPKVQALRKKPTLEDHEYDSDAYVGDIEKWVEEKKNIDAENLSRQQQEQEQNKKHQIKQENYEQEKKALKIRNYEDYEHAVIEKLSQTQQGILVSAAKKPTILVAALGGNPKILKQFSEIKDPIEFTVALVELEMKLKVSKRSAPPAPDKPLTGGRGKIGGGVNATLEKLRAEAERTNDYTKVHQYNRQIQKLK